MRLKDLRWYILASIILLISYAAIGVGFYLPVKAKTISSMQTITEEAITNEVDYATELMDIYYDRFISGDIEKFNTDFNKTGYATKISGNKYMIAEGDYFLNNADDKLYVFFYNPSATNETYIGGYIAFENIVKFSTKSILFFNSTDGIKYNTLNDAPIGTMTRLLNDDNFLNDYNNNYNGKAYSKVYMIDGVEGLITVSKLLDFNYAIFVPLESSIYSINWVSIQAITYYVIGILIIGAVILLIVLGARKASVILRVDRHAVENTHSLIIRVKKDGRIVFTNIAFKKLLNLKQIPNLDDFKEVHTDEPIFKFFKGKRVIQCYFDSGDTRKYLQLTPIGVLSTFYLVGSDITEEFLRIQSLEEMNGKNEYTNCNNNFALNNMFPSICARAESDLSFIEFSIFKHLDIISLFGHDNYVLLLKELLSILRIQFEGMDIYHTRDERFLVIYPNADVKDVISIVNKTVKILKKPILIRTNNIYVNLKVSICNVEKEELNSISLIEIKRRIELAYNTILDFSSKDVSLYNEAMEGVITARMQMEEDLKLAIEKKEFVQYLQPQFDLSANRIVGFESLIRWNNPNYINKSPQAYIGLAEQKGYILDISRFVIDNTFMLAKKLEEYNVTVSLNLSPIQILQVGFVNDLENKFKEYDLRPGSIALEITETFLMENYLLVSSKLKILKLAGFRIHLDDFGTGYSSMAYLKDLPVDTIKIDHEFTKYVDTNKVNYSIVSCISTLAKELGLDVIVEGVETLSQQAVVKKLGCRIIQGYLIGKATTYDDAITLLKRTNRK